MTRSGGQKLKLLHLARFLFEETDEQNPASMPQIIEALSREGIAAERKALYDDLEALRAFGMDIICVRDGRYGYYVGSRPFELAELKLLVDAVQCSRFITTRKSGQLIRKLEQLTSRGQAGQLQRQVYLDHRVKASNESIYYSVDTLHTAISEKCRASFRYLEYTPDMRRRYRRDGQEYVVNPVALTWDNEKYYLIAYDAGQERYVHYRVDRMEQVRTLIGQPADRVPDTPAFDLSQYTRRLFTMFTGEEQRVEIEFCDALINVVADRFGEDVKIVSRGDGRFRISVRVAASPPFLAWIMQFGAGARVVAPQSVVTAMRQLLSELADCYASGPSAERD